MGTHKEELDPKPFYSHFYVVTLKKMIKKFT